MNEMSCSGRTPWTTAVILYHQVSHRACVQVLSTLGVKSSADLCRGIRCSRGLPQCCADWSIAPNSDYSETQISEHPEYTSITAGAFRSTAECVCTVGEHLAQLLGDMGGCGSTLKHWWWLPESLGGLHVASSQIYILLMFYSTCLLLLWFLVLLYLLSCTTLISHCYTCRVLLHLLISSRCGIFKYYLKITLQNTWHYTSEVVR